LTYTLEIKQTTVVRDKKRRNISLVTFNHRKVVADPLTSVNDYDNNVWSIRNDRPEVGFTSTEVDQDIQGFKAWLTTTVVGQLFGREA
jgi:hypothetical protein